MARSHSSQSAGGLNTFSTADIVSDGARGAVALSTVFRFEPEVKQGKVLSHFCIEEDQIHAAVCEVAKISGSSLPLG